MTARKLPKAPLFQKWYVHVGSQCATIGLVPWMSRHQPHTSIECWWAGSVPPWEVEEWLRRSALRLLRRHLTGRWDES